MIRWRLRWVSDRRLQKMDSWLHIHAKDQKWWKHTICDAYDRRMGWDG